LRPNKKAYNYNMIVRFSKGSSNSLQQTYDT